MVKDDILKLVNGVSRLKTQLRSNDIFELIFEVYPNPQKHRSMGASENIPLNSCWLAPVVVDFCTLIILSKGDFHISNTGVYLFEDKRFFISNYLLTPNELKILGQILMQSELLSTWNKTTMLETIPVKFEFPMKARKRLIQMFFNYLIQTAWTYFVGFPSMLEGKFTLHDYCQYQIRVYQKIGSLCDLIQTRYKIDLQEQTKTLKGFTKKIQQIFGL